MNLPLYFDHYSIDSITAEDAENFCTFVLNNREAVESSAPITAKAVKDIDSAIKFVDERITKAEKKELVTMLVKDTATGKVIASIVLMNIDLTVPKGEFGYYIDKHYEGKGITTKAISLLCDYFFTEQGFNKLFMRISDLNKASKRVAEKNGFAIEGILKSDYRNFKDELVDLTYYGKVRVNRTPTGNKIHYRKGTVNDIEELKQLGLISYGQYESLLTHENVLKMRNNMSAMETWTEVLAISTCFVGVLDSKIIGMAFFIPSGNPNELFEKEWSYIRLLGVHPAYGGKGIGKELTRLCIDCAKAGKEKTIALHTSEIMHSARHIYEKAGFRVLKEIPPRLGLKYWIYTMNLTWPVL
jgi:RimJ/RimL family protein N-acetyltransferase